MPDLSDDETDALLKWSVFGQAGTPQVGRYVPTPDDLARVHPIARPEVDAWSYALDEAQTAALLNGFRATAMEEKWNIWSEDVSPSGATSVTFARSWTGQVIMRVDLQVAGSTSRVVSAIRETDPAHLKDTSESFARWTFEGCFPSVLGVPPPTASPD